MMFTEVGVQWFRAYALMLDGMMGHRMMGSQHPGDVFLRETRERRFANRRTRGEIGIDEGTRPWELHSSMQALLK